MDKTGNNRLFQNAAQVLTLAGEAAPRRGLVMNELGILKDASVLVRNGKVEWIGDPATQPAPPHPDAPA